MMRYSLGREPRMEKAKVVRKLDSNLAPRAKDDDLVLFNDMQSKERDCFLLHTDDDIDDSIAKLRYFSDYKSGINFPIHGESSDLLNTDGDKNDYDWLLTPPDTPLFPSLDDDEIQPVGLPQRGRRSEPIAIPRSSTDEKAQRSSRSSASPHRLSPSPRSSSCGRASSAPQSSPPTVQRQTTPSRRSSAPPNKSSTPPRRSTTPTLLRMSSGSSSQASSSGRRGISPVKTNRGNSSSPKLQGWQSNLPGFSSDVPPNLRTSLSDRSPSCTRGSSPASRNGRDSSSQHGRQSISPTASRSATSSHRQDHFSFYNRGSAASSGEDDVDSLQSANLGISGDPNARKNIVMANNRSMTLSKRSSRNPYATSAPKRSFDPVQRKDNHNMFRPLLSSVPSTTFYYGKSSTLQRPIFSRNSSLTTSSNTSSEQGVSVIHDIGGVHEQKDLAAELEKRRGRGTQEVFVFDKFSGGTTAKVGAKQLERSSESLVDRISASESSCTGGHNSEVDICVLTICPSCGNRFRIVDMDEETVVCENCTRNDDHITPGESNVGLAVIHDYTVQLETDIANDILSKEEQFNGDITKLPENSDCLLETCSSQLMIDETSQHHDEEYLNTYHDEISCQYDNDNKVQPSKFPAHPCYKIKNSPAAGISVLLERPGCSKGPLLQGRVFSATSILCSEPSYTQENTSSMNRSFSRDSGSASSSIDLGSSRQSEPRIQRHSSNKKPEGNMGNKSPGLLYPGIQSGAHAVLLLSKSNEEDSMDSYAKDLDSEFSTELKLPTRRQSLDAEICTTPASSLHEDVANGVLPFDDSDVINTRDLQFGHPDDDHIPDTMDTQFLKEGCGVAASAEEVIQRTGPNFQSMNAINITAHSSDDNTSTGIACHIEVNAAEENHSAIDLGRITDHEAAYGLDTEHCSSSDPINVPDSLECSTLTKPETTIESNMDHEESTVEVESRHTRRTLALSEATDTILFCSSIIHDIAYNAAAIAMEKELASAAASPRPAVPISGKSVFRQQVSRTIPRRRASKSQKTKRKKLEADSNALPPGPVDEGKSPGLRPIDQGSATKVDMPMAPKVESRCNCTVM